MARKKSERGFRTRARNKSGGARPIPMPPSPASDHSLGDRLEQHPPPPRAASPAGQPAPTQLTNLQVERVLGRAAEIDSGLDDDLTTNVSALIAAANEVGLSEASMRQAIAEVRLAEPEPEGFFARLLVGDEIVETDVVALDAAAADKILHQWMRTSEGLRPARTDDGTTKWERDRSLATRVRLGINRETSGLRLDVSSKVSHTLIDVGSSESVVAVKVDTETLRQASTGGLAATGVVGAGVMVPLLAGSDGVAETLAILASTGLGVGGIGSAIVFATRIHVKQLREALRRPIDAVTRAEPISAPPSLIETVVDTVAEAAERIRSKRKPSG